MMKYNWTIDTLIERLNLIQKLLTVETDPEKLQMLKTDYYILQNHIENYYGSNRIDKMKLLENYRQIKSKLNQVDFLWTCFQEYLDIVDKSIITPELKACALSCDDLLIITHDFYKSLNQFFFRNFMKNFCRRKDHIIFQNYNNDCLSGITIALPGLKESFIKIFREYNAEDILTTIHEYSHATSISINPYHLQTEKELYNEIDSLFMELIATDYIEDLLKDNSSTIFKAEILNDYFSIAEDISIIINIIKCEPKYKNGYSNNKELKYIAKLRYGLISDRIDYILNNQNSLSTTYLTSFMFALELYKLYKEDKEKALYYLKKIILLKDMSKKEYYYNIRKFGLIPNLSLQEIFNETQKDALKLTKIKSNSHF